LDDDISHNYIIFGLLMTNLQYCWGDKYLKDR
jgi:hypothetical protein